MCCLFGLIDYRGTLTAKQKTRLIRELSIAAEVRGTDATGIAYNTEHGLQIYKRPIPAHRLRLNIPSNAKVIMGHTRMATQGRAKKNENNHPFRGSIEARHLRWPITVFSIMTTNCGGYSACQLQKSRLTATLPCSCLNRKTPSTLPA